MSDGTFVPRQEVVPLGEGFYMVKHMSDSMCNHLWYLMDDNQMGELKAIYGDSDEAARAGLWDEIRTSGHQAAFFDGTTLVCGMWADWCDITGVGRKRVIGCFCNSEYAKRMTRKFVKFTPICRDAFELGEPSDVDELLVFIATGYKSSREWAVRVGGFEQYFHARFDAKRFVCYHRKIGGGNGV